MLKKRFIFTLLYDSGKFMLSRNFKLQQVGDLKWLKNNYKFWENSKFIDEIIILDVSRGETNFDDFVITIQNVVSSCFVPVAAGGGIRTLNDVEKLISAGADKVVINALYHLDTNEIEKIIRKFGAQVVVASVDYKHENNADTIYINHGKEKVQLSLQEHIERIQNIGAGEIMLNSIDRDGTGQGYDVDLVNRLGMSLDVPLILSGGAGRIDHFSEVLQQSYDAVTTSNLFNFMGDGLKRSRENMRDAGIDIPTWVTSC